MKVQITKCNTPQKLSLIMLISHQKIQAEMLTSSAPYSSLKFRYSNKAKILYLKLTTISDFECIAYKTTPIS